MKILYHHRTASRDGQAVHIGELTAALARRGHELIVVGPPATERQEFGGESGLVSRLRRHLPKAVAETLELAYAVAAYRRLDAAWRAHRPDVLYERYNLFLPAGVWLRERRGLPMLLEVNSPLLAERRAHGGLALPTLGRWSERRAWRGADRVLPVTRVLAEAVRAQGVPEERIAVIPNGVDLDRFPNEPDTAAAKARLGLDGRWVLGFTGFLREWHRLDRVVGFLAAGAPPSAHLLLVGDGPAREPLEQLARARGVADRLTVTGIVPRDAVADHVAAFDVALQPAVTAYASPLKLFEYMAMGRPIVAPRTANLEEVLRDGRDALLVDPEDDRQLAVALARLAADPALARRIGRGARETIERDGYTWDRNAERVEALARELLATPPSARVAAVAAG